MSASHYRRETCRLCDSKNLELVIQPAATPPGDRYVAAEALDKVQETYPLDVFFCQDCGLLQLIDVVDPDILYGNYIYTTSISLGLVEHFRQYAIDVLQRINPPASALVIDIGSNDGTILRHFQDRGMRVLGVEPAAHIAQKATESGIETLATFFNPEVASEIKQKYGAATIITANNVFANIDDLPNTLEGIRHLLAPDGVFVMETGYCADTIRNDVFDNIYHEHLTYFNVKPLESFFRRHDMELIHVDHVATKGGSIRCTAQLKGGSRPVSPSVKAMIDAEVRLGMDRATPYLEFAAKIQGVKEQLLDLLKDLKAQGKTIAGYGASVGVTTLLYYFELSELLSFLVDDNPIRHDLFSPGHHIPVLPSQELYERKPDYVLILAWRYAEPIMSKHQAYLAQGGHFIQFLPELKVI
ncbi:class I SAM-dependent methyltransferase [Lusitaniella coriacea LEGE 07157]|uniref:Class I SAM-dependent methyltransferase n=1 Tax=Lusitaniella coriacea LEGE 07157 TaxID=945747 RepID=A0A8J7JBA2_9CYAN|nr:class I SAM-dependent methyltransferase [Lusitaniella coriacea]MBE9116860.1 class I SAM-dependent methyltransferase [Lusitaniella coriacea LEGE 07157]